MSTHPKEQVLVITAALAKRLAPKPFSKVVAYETTTHILADCSFREREEAEKNFDFKQVIPYIVVTHGTKYLLAQRTTEQQEKRLHNLFSIGQGGHVNNLDFGQERSPIVVGLLREIDEEFHLGQISSMSMMGCINDDSNEVGRVHLGLVYIVSVDTPKLEVAEHGKHTAVWADLLTLDQHYDRMENWSKIVMDHVVRPSS